jgi:DNA-binding transcriptional LysR family regulator
MEIERLNEFVVFAKHKTVSAAAREMYITQPCLSNHIQDLERYLGFKLIDRTGTKLSLTPAGQEFLGYAQSLLKTLAQAKETCAALAATPPPAKIASCPTRSFNYKLLAEYVDAAYTMVDVEDDMAALFQLLRKKIIDVAFASDYRATPTWQADMDANNLMFEPGGFRAAAVCFMKSHPLAEQTNLTAEIVSRYPLSIFRGDHYDGWRHVVKQMFPADTKLDFVLIPLDSLSNLSSIDLKETVHICGAESIDNVMAERDDIIVHTEVEGMDLHFTFGLLRRQDESNVNVLALIEQLKIALATTSE